MFIKTLKTQDIIIAIQTHSQPRACELRIGDTGTGIPKAVQPRIFEPFYTTKAPGAGLGLGLSISARIIDDLGGRLQAGVSPLGGARFTIELPQAEHVLPPHDESHAT